MTGGTEPAKTTGAAINTGTPGEHRIGCITGNMIKNSTGIMITEITNTGIVVGKGIVGTLIAGGIIITPTIPTHTGSTVIITTTQDGDM